MAEPTKAELQLDLTAIVIAGIADAMQMSIAFGDGMVEAQKVLATLAAAGAGCQVLEDGGDFDAAIAAVEAVLDGE